METTDTITIRGFQLRVVTNGYVVTVSGEPFLSGDEYAFDSLTDLLNWLRLKLPIFLSYEEKERILKAESPILDGNSPTS